MNHIIYTSNTSERSKNLIYCNKDLDFYSFGLFHNQEKIYLAIPKRGKETQCGKISWFLISTQRNKILNKL